jgi:hypothetical protein
LKYGGGFPGWRRDEWRKQVMGVFLVTTKKRTTRKGDHEDEDESAWAVLGVD